VAKTLLVFPEDPGRRKLRFLFGHENGFRVVAWLRVGADGSLYFNHRIVDGAQAMSGKRIADGLGGFTDLEVIQRALEAGEDPKLSHHASGIVTRGPRERSRSVSLRGLSTPTLIRQEEFAPPGRFALIGKERIRKTDVVVLTGSEPFALDPHHRLSGRVWVAPLLDGEAQIVDPNDIADGTSVVVPYTNLDGCPDLTVQILFFNDPEDRGWPEHSLSAILDDLGAND
jgi:hypothetical protein